MNRRSNRQLLRAATAFMMVGALAACGTAAKESGETVVSTPAPTTTAVETPDPDPVLWPLTGLEADPDADVDRAVVSVKIENSRAARPQIGINEADLVWVQMVEGGTTRFVAMYQSNYPDVVGPIRSIRPMDAMIAGPLSEVLAFSGGQHSYVSAASQADLVTLSFDAADAGFSRDSTRRPPHHVIGDVEIFALAAPPEPTRATENWPTPGGTDGDKTQGARVNEVTLRYPGAVSSWNWLDSGWERSDDSVASVDAAGEPIKAENIVIMRVTITYSNERDSSGASVPITQLIGSGEAEFLVGDEHLRGTWQAGEDGFALFDEAGQPVPLDPGRTWIELLPTGGDVTIG